MPVALGRLAFSAVAPPAWLVTVRRTDGDLGLFGSAVREGRDQRLGQQVAAVLNAFLDVALRGADESVLADAVDAGSRQLVLERRR